MTREYRLAVKHITKSFKKEKILEDVNLDFSGGHIYGIVGKNGTGKSVLFKMICGFIHADEGEIEVNGKKLEKILISRKVWEPLLKHRDFYHISLV